MADSLRPPGGAREAPTTLLRGQLDRGFILLRFRRELEADFLRYLRVSGQISRLTLLLIAFFAMVITPLIDTTLLGLPPALVVPSRWLQLGGMLPLVVGAGLYCWRRPKSATIEAMMVLLFAGFVAGLLAQRVIDARYGFDIPVEYVGVCTVGMFVLARIRFWVMLASAIVAGAATVAVEITLVHMGPNINYHLFATTVLMVIAICAGYSMEYFIRWTWLNGTLLRYLSRQDSLTGLLNRNALEGALERGQMHARREELDYAIAMVDIDVFGAYNDYYGHQVGDAALRRVASVLRASARRPLDVCGRYGGEEFVVLWMDGDAAELCALAESTRAVLENERIAHAVSPVAPWVTVSIGCCHVSVGDGEIELDAVLRKADTLLYDAKA